MQAKSNSDPKSLFGLKMFSCGLAKLELTVIDSSTILCVVIWPTKE